MKLRREFLTLYGIMQSFLNGKWYPKNIQPKYPLEADFKVKFQVERGKIGICPHYTLLEVIAEMLYVTPEEFQEIKQFCGYTETPIMVDGPYGRHGEIGGASQEPVTCCRALHDMLGVCIGILQTVEPPPINVDIHASREYLQEAQANIAKWRQFKEGQCVYEELSESISRLFPTLPFGGWDETVKSLTTIQARLEEQVTGDTDNMYGILWKPVCVQAPQRKYNQWLHID